MILFILFIFLGLPIIITIALVATGYVYTKGTKEMIKNVKENKKYKDMEKEIIEHEYNKIKEEKQD